MKWLTQTTWCEAIGAGAIVLGALCFGILFSAIVNAAEQDTPAAAVVAVTDSDGNRKCSAVVVAPETAYTARHCATIGMKIETPNEAYDVPTAMVYVSGIDAAVLHVPGLPCPCATPSAVVPSINDEVTVVGFSEGGSKTVKTARVLLVGDVNDLPEYKIKRNYEIRYTLIAYAPAVLKGGDSGGGTFVFRDGAWALVGINTYGIPDPKTFNPVASMFGVEQDEIGSASVPVARHMELK